jgi:hypothetical protein
MRGTRTDTGVYSRPSSLSSHLCKVLLKLNGPFTIPVPKSVDSKIALRSSVEPLDSSI